MNSDREVYRYHDHCDYDAVIAGGGPAGLSAAIYLARAKYRVLVIEKEQIGGQITITSEVVNYPGVLSTDGKKLTETMRQQAENFGAEFLAAEVKDIEIETDIRTVKTSKGAIRTLGLILATGASPRMVGFSGEAEFRGRGVAYCATCDGEFFTGLDVFVVGGGFAAAEEAMFLTKYAKKVTILVRKDKFSCADSVVEEVMNHPDIEVRFHTEIEAVGGDTFLKYAVLRNNETGVKERYEAEPGKTFGIFVFAGYAPATDSFKNKVEINENGYLVTDRSQKTSVDGVYGAGDVCVKNLRQVVTAVSDGAIAATSLEKYISGMYEELGLEKPEVKAVKKPQTQAAKQPAAGLTQGSFLSAEMKVQLQEVFARFASPVLLKAYVSEDKPGMETKEFVDEISSLSEYISYEVHGPGAATAAGITCPAIVLCSADGTYRNVQFHGVPGGHEINSFVIALYNAAGPGQPLDETDLARIRALDKDIAIDIIVSLSCTMCPELVMAAQQIALENDRIEAQMYDMAHFPEMKDKYQIMSVPCFVIRDKETGAEKVWFGKKNISQMLDILEQCSGCIGKQMEN